MIPRKYQTRLLAAAFTGTLIGAMPVAAAPLVPATVPLANIDVVPADLLLALSVEYPTGDTTSYLKSDPTYNRDKTYYGYFDPGKCYSYSKTNSYFSPVTTCAGDTPRGNFLNWLTMTSLDQFRKVLTGGNRFVDKVGQTVLQRSYNDAKSDTGSYMPTVRGKIPHAGNMGSSSKTWTYRNVNLGDKLLIQEGDYIDDGKFSNAELATSSCDSLVAAFKSKNGGNKPAWTCYHVRVEVCKSDSGMQEDNCAKYGNNYKPEGLMQQYHKNLRFAAFGYLVDQNPATQGGVLRARMKSVGPKMFSSATKSEEINDATEWDGGTGVFKTNPDPADASASGVTNSGVINYLNKFGYNQPASSEGKAYKGFDPMAEMYYEALRYLRGLKPSSKALPNSPSSGQLDGFPAIRFGGSNAAAGSTTVSPPAADDPVVSACQKIAILTIGDVNNHCDTGVPGGRTSACGGRTVPNDDTITGTAKPGTDFKDLTDKINGLEATPPAKKAGVGADDSPGRDAGWYLGGMAYWSHINDMRPDLSTMRRSGAIQNIDNYFFDVLEPWNNAIQDGTKTPGPTPMYLAAKYGGFDLAKTDQSTPANKNNPNTFAKNSAVKSWDTNNDNVPDSWYGGNDPLKMKTGLTRIFDSAVAAGITGLGGAPGASSTSLVNVSKSFFATYDLTNGGRGTLKACPWNASGGCPNPTWSSDDWLTPDKTDFQRYSDRVIVTRSGGTGVAFDYASLSGGDKTNLAFNPVTDTADAVATPGATSTAELRVRYLRGDFSNEIRKSGVFRSRNGTLLGDIVYSGPVHVGPPTAPYGGSKYSGYDDFRKTNKSRQAMVYVGANDGMLHGFNADSGKEVFAYVPGYFLQPNSGKKAARISLLADPTYQHSFFVDATPMVGDINVGGTWKTMLVGGLGAGGKAFYALDVTNPANLTEGKAGDISLWEVTDSDIGYTYNQPTLSPITGQPLQYSLVRTGSDTYAWRIIVGNGFGSANGDAYLLMLDPANGGITKIAAGTGIADNGLATPFPMDTRNDGVVDVIWAGDIKGNMWRFRWSGSAWTSTIIFKTGGKPITSAPAVTRSNNGANKFIVVFGTGKYIENADSQDSSQQSIYGIVDDINATNTVVESSLVKQTITSGTGGTRTYSTNTSTTATGGWYLDLPLAQERVTMNPMVSPDTGIVSVLSFTPPKACLDPTTYVNPLNVYTGGQARDYSGANGTLADFTGYSVTGIASLGGVVSDSTQAGVIAGGENDRFRSAKGAPNKGLRGSWRQIH